VRRKKSGAIPQTPWVEDGYRACIGARGLRQDPLQG
jgi:hypothetical protein